MTRSLGTVTDAIIAANEIEYWNFVSIELASPVGLMRFTDRPYGFTGNIDGTSQTWNEADLEVGPIFQSRQEVLQVSWMKFANLDYTWTNWGFTPGLRDSKVNIYTGWWNTSTPTPVFAGAYKIYEGLVDAVELSAYAQLTLRPHHVPWSYKVPPIQGGRCINVYRNPEDCQYFGAEPVGQVTCPKTRQGCIDRGNTINLNIYDDAPKHGEILVYGVKVQLPSFSGE